MELGTVLLAKPTPPDGRCETLPKYVQKHLNLLSEISMANGTKVSGFIPSPTREACLKSNKPSSRGRLCSHSFAVAVSEGRVQGRKAQHHNAQNKPRQVQIIIEDWSSLDGPSGPKVEEEKEQRDILAPEFFVDLGLA